MEWPDYDTMKFATAQSKAATELEYFNEWDGESSPLKRGDRVYLLTAAGEFPGIVKGDWVRPSDGQSVSDDVCAVLDSRPTWPIELHRSLFRAFTVLDHIASI